MKKKKYYKKRKTFINQFINFLEYNEAYKSFKKTNEQNKKMNDEINALTYWSIIFFDVYNNKELNSLVKKISKLDKHKYQVELTLIPKKSKDLNYLQLQYDYTSITSLVKVKLLDDQFIREITSSFTQINNNQVIVKYDLHFKNVIKNENLIEFIKSNKKNLYEKNFIDYYDLDKIIESKSFSSIFRIFEKLLKSSFQAKLMEIASLNKGKKYNLPSCLVINYPKDLYSKVDFQNAFLKDIYEINGGDQYLLSDVTTHEGLDMELYFSGTSYRSISFMNLISTYRMNFYYLLFSEIEKIEMNYKLNRYFNESKKNISSADYKWLINKIRAINENKLHTNYENSHKKNIIDWKLYYSGEEKKLDFIDNTYINKFENIYSKCLEHIQIIYSLQKENLIINIASFTLLAALIGIFVTFILN